MTESENSTKSGRFKEVLGNYDPRKAGETLKTDRIQYWLSQGVLPTPTVHNLLVEKGLVKAGKIASHKVSTAKTPEEVPAGDTMAQ